MFPDTNLKEMPSGIIELIPSKKVYDHGVYHFGYDGHDFVVVSFKEFADVIEGIGRTLSKYPNATVVTPELITSIDQGKETLSREVLSKNQQVISLSKSFPEATIVLGTIEWLEGSVKPTNCLLVVRAGEIYNLIPKSYPTEDEKADFAIQFSSNNSVFPQVDAMVCLDLLLDSSHEVAKRRSVGDAALIRNLLAADTRVVLVSSCWGFGSRVTRSMIKKFAMVRSGQSTVEDYAHKSFIINLMIAVKMTVEKYPNLEMIVFCDRAPTFKSIEDTDPVVSTRAFNGVFRREDFIDV